ncbi:VanZ family protein [Psychroserpens sp. MEBiC05023]
MITKLLLVLKKWALPIVILYVIILTLASLIQLKDMPSFGFSFDDKIYHTLAYLILTLLVYNYVSTKNFKRSMILSAGIAIGYGIIIEVLQFVLTTHRSFDVFDAVANTLGALLAVMVLKYLIKTKVKMN